MAAGPWLGMVRLPTVGSVSSVDGPVVVGRWCAGQVAGRGGAVALLTGMIRGVHRMSRGTYGVPRVHAELRLAAGVRCGRKRVARLMRADGLQGVYRPRRTGCTVRDPAAAPSADLVNRRSVADRPDALWFTDVTQHRTD